MATEQDTTTSTKADAPLTERECFGQITPRTARLIGALANWIVANPEHERVKDAFEYIYQVAEAQAEEYDWLDTLLVAIAGRFGELMTPPVLSITGAANDLHVIVKKLLTEDFA